MNNKRENERKIVDIWRNRILKDRLREIRQIANGECERKKVTIWFIEIKQNVRPF